MHAEAECLADEPARARRRERDAKRRASDDLKLQSEMAAAITDMYPACPSERAQAIARHAATRRSGRVGRSAAGRALDPRALELAVTASVRHQDTSYDELLMSGIDRSEARERVRDAVGSILDAWRHNSRGDPEWATAMVPSRRPHALGHPTVSGLRTIQRLSTRACARGSDARRRRAARSPAWDGWHGSARSRM